MDPAVKKIIDDMVSNPTAKIEMFAGMKKVKGTYEGGTAEFEPTGGKTMVIHINGGANNVRVERIKIEGEED